ncbi:type IV pilus biogenesis and competence protein PilQ [Geobacter sp. OR-1]|uniref:secretin N-terminal domain-containing protein n=1 Tax=Geobacter sp. OR-1 TaxID=1266765 RepID=UPI000542D0AD|nr:secretin N-terminal domain-containing protein [Geobacter sp. OR-1]GAM10649.1 type IV pilus biogenesis and competence protein PilQ [Geobacter sp. OR-1]
MYKIKPFLIVLPALLVIVAGCSGGRSAFSKAQKLEAEGKLDEAVVKYAEAASESPEEGEYRMRFLGVSEQAARIHMNKGEQFLEKGNLDDALREFQSAVALDSSLATARQASEKVVKLRNSQVYLKEGEELEKNRKTREAILAYKKALEFNPDNEKASTAIVRLQKGRKSKLDGSELNLKSTKPITLKFKDAKIKDVFNIITQLSGINFVFDEGVKDSNVTIYLENATFQQALDVITGLNKLGKKVLNENTIILYTKSPEKLKQYEDLMVQTFYLNKLDAKKAVNLIRTMLQVKKIYVNEEMNALVIRDVPDVIEVAGRILEANDVPDAEVLLEVEVIEVAKKNTEALGLVLSKYALSMNTWTPQGAFFSDALTSTTTSSSSTTGTTTTTTPITPSNLLQTFSWRNFQGYMTVPSATFNFGKTLSNAETLASPKIRVKNREKAKFNVGTRVPITTTSSPTGGGVSVNVQYVDVGVKVNAEPTIQLNNEVNMKLSLEVSSILTKEKIGDSASLTTVVTIGTRNLDTVLSLKDGETSVIGGLIQDNKTKSKQKVMILGDLPIIGPLLTGSDNSNDKSELILAITPRIVRGVAVPEGEAAQFWSGREDEPSVHKPYGSFVSDADDIEDDAKAPAKPPQLYPSSPKPASTSSAPGQSLPILAPGQSQQQQPVKPASTGSLPAAAPAVSAQPQTLQPSQLAAQTDHSEIKVAPQPAPPSSPQQAVAQKTVSVPTPVPTAVVPSPVPGTPVVLQAPPKPQNEQKPGQPTVESKTQQLPARVSVTIAAPPLVKVKDQFVIDIKATEVSGLKSAPFILAYDPIFVEFVGASPGDLLKSDGKQPAFRAANDKSTGQVTFNISSSDDTSAVSGSGKIASVTFKARNQGPASFGLMGVNFIGLGGRQIETLPYNTVVEVK